MESAHEIEKRRKLEKAKKKKGLISEKEQKNENKQEATVGVTKAKEQIYRDVASFTGKLESVFGKMYDDFEFIEKEIEAAEDDPDRRMVLRVKRFEMGKGFLDTSAKLKKVSLLIEKEKRDDEFGEQLVERIKRLHRPIEELLND